MEHGQYPRHLLDGGSTRVGRQGRGHLLVVQEAASHTDPRTTMRYDRGRQSLDRHATYIVATFVAGASRNPTDPEFGRGDRSGLELRIGQSVALAKGSMGSVAAPRRA